MADAVSPRVRELIRQGAGRALEPLPGWRSELERAVLSSPARRQLGDDPDLAAAARRAIESTIATWISSHQEAPGEPVPADVSDVSAAIARDLVRRGLDQAALDAYRAGHAVAWQHWMEIAFSLTDSPEELHELLAVSARSMSAYIDATVRGISELMERERDQLTRGADADRRQLVALLLQGAPVGAARARARLGYGVEGRHWACVVWSNRPDPDVSELERVGEQLTASARSVSVVASTGTRWIWTSAPPDLDATQLLLREVEGVFVSAAGPAEGLEGFRRSHLDALTAQRLLASAASDVRVTTYDEVALVALVTEDRAAAARFVQRTLGDLAGAEPELRDTARAFIRSGSSATAAARSLWTHRNTVLRRLAAARERLPDPERGWSVEVAVALDVVASREVAELLEPLRR